MSVVEYPQSLGSVSNAARPCASSLHRIEAAFFVVWLLAGRIPKGHIDAKIPPLPCGHNGPV